eukprot:TRINITY_DN60017_c0_g1_i1.p1 TRINITY_DN60017_c0_g1~~TRINITY_DN60017_c0_g1_i1.p1  ORF type:complete len:477 (+),score=75.97 TRINITY_DN60017_c0_g1_i1:58-1488(+)
MDTESDVESHKHNQLEVSPCVCKEVDNDAVVVRRTLHDRLRPLTPTLERCPTIAFTLYGALSSFFCYFAMYAFRKPFKAGTLDGVMWGETGMSLKVALVLAQLLGYMTAKIVGVKYCAEAKKHNVSLHLIALITFAQATLVLYGILPANRKVLAMFLNGLPLGVIWGLVVTFLEGRRTSDYMLACLCIAFIVSSGVVKDVALWVLEIGIDEFWMPAVVGGMFYPMFVLCVWLLYQMPAPTAEDVQMQSDRKALSHKDRVKYVKGQWPGLFLLWFGVAVLTAYRDYRDTFGVELFAALGEPLTPGVFSRCEQVVGATILVAVGSLGTIKSNRRSSMASLTCLLLGALVLFLASLWLHCEPHLNGLLYMVLTGIGSYLSYVPYNSVLFERLTAYTLAEGTVAFPMAVSDAVGYAGVLAVYLVKEFGPAFSYLDFFQGFGLVAAVSTAIAYALALLYYFVFFPRWRAVCADEPPKQVAH